MRRRLLCAGLLLSLLCSCAAPVESSAPTAVETPAAFDILTPEEAAVHCAQVLLDSQSDGESYRLLPQEDVEFYLSEVYGIPEDSRGTAALVYTAGGVDARELAVIYGTSDVTGNTAAGALEGYRQNRVGDFTGYAPDQADLAERAIVREGNLALLMICTDPEAAQKAMEKELSHLVIKPYDPSAEPPEPYDWTKYVNEKGWKLCDPPGEFDMTPYDTSAILTAWETGEERGLSEKDAAILTKCREVFGAHITGGMTDFQREVALHDWLMDWGSYDQTVHDPQTPMGREDNANPYGMLVNRYGICLGYATTFQLFMDLAGVECITVVGASAASTSDHAWNMVKLEGEWYCVDPTWDDSTIPHPEAYTREELSRRHHYYFNVTSQDLRDSDHQWDYENIPEATATSFRWDGMGMRPNNHTRKDDTMRVITGTARGRKLKDLPGLDTRPTTDKVKESIFNIVQFDIEGRRVLDLFAGTGQLGIEALSRGAEKCVFVDQSREAVKVIQENVKTTGFENQSRVAAGDAISFLTSCREKFGLAFLDPPYASDLLERALFKMSEIDIIAENGIIVCESAVDKVLPILPTPYEMGRDYRYGKIKLTLYHRRADG